MAERHIPEMPKDPYYAFDESWTPPHGQLSSEDVPVSTGTHQPRKRVRAVFAGFYLSILAILWEIPWWVYVAVFLLLFWLVMRNVMFTSKP